ncbi:hypothetical protein R3P38DRAFT_3601236 [Favolaschia claudopus]|uniref:F-box domain-containing protein n=1 Tax=Favolaschia claudopus TaxID=2862362 RepID=A0AAW0ABT3_9AGAR
MRRKRKSVKFKELPKGNTEYARGLFGDASTFKSIPTELLSLIFEFAAGGSPLLLPCFREPRAPRVAIPALLSQVCRRWRYIAIQTLWHRLSFGFGYSGRYLHLPVPYRDKLEHCLNLISPYRLLDIELHACERLPQGVLQNIVVENAPRLRFLHVDLDEESTEIFMRLPHHMFPVLKDLSIHFVGQKFTLFLEGSVDDFTPIAQLAPGLTRFGFSAQALFHPLSLGVNLGQLQSLSLDMRVQQNQFFEDILPLLSGTLQSLKLKLFAKGLQSSSDLSRKAYSIINFRCLSECRLTFPTYMALTQFFLQVKLPALKDLSLTAAFCYTPNEAYSSLFHYTLLSAFRGFDIQLNSLELSRILELTNGYLMSLLVNHGTRLTSLNITGCTGNGTKELFQSEDITLLPKLTAFTSYGLEETLFRPLVQFIMRRTDRAWDGPSRVKEVRLSTSSHLQYNRAYAHYGNELILAAKAWREVGVDVFLSCVNGCTAWDWVFMSDNYQKNSDKTSDGVQVPRGREHNYGVL